MAVFASILTTRVAKEIELDLISCSAVTLENQGNSRVWCGFKSQGSANIDIDPGQSRTFKLSNGAIFNDSDKIIIAFDGEIVPDGVQRADLCLSFREKVDLSSC